MSQKHYTSSEVGDDFFTGEAAAAAQGENASASHPVRSSAATGVPAMERSVPSAVGRGFGRGPIGVDSRKFKYDVNRARLSAPVSFGASKVDRMDAAEAGNVLHDIHVMVGLDREDEARILAFDKALWLQHTLNGASLLQPGRGTLKVGEQTEFDISVVLSFLGERTRRFFRAFADDIAQVNVEVLASCDAWDRENYEKAQQVRQVAIERGLQRYPHLCHDSSDACLDITMEERVAVLSSKRIVLADSYNAVDTSKPRSDGNPAVGTSSAGGRIVNGK